MVIYTHILLETHHSKIFRIIFFRQNFRIIKSWPALQIPSNCLFMLSSLNKPCHKSFMISMLYYKPLPYVIVKVVNSILNFQRNSSDILSILWLKNIFSIYGYQYQYILPVFINIFYFILCTHMIVCITISNCLGLFLITKIVFIKLKFY